MTAGNPESSEMLDGWERHRRDQLRDIAARTTPAERMQWLEDMIELFKDRLPELLKNRQRVIDEDRSINPIKSAPLSKD